MVVQSHPKISQKCRLRMLALLALKEVSNFTHAGSSFAGHFEALPTLGGTRSCFVIRFVKRVLALIHF